MSTGTDMRCVVRQLTRCGIRRWYTVNDLLDFPSIGRLPFPERVKVETAWFHQKYASGHMWVGLATLDFVITERCSLKCRECSNLMQYYQNPRDFALERLKSTLGRVLEIYDEIYELRLLGGEPLMYKEMSPLLLYLNDIPQIRRICCIFTNGTIVPAPKALDGMAAGGKTWFSISNYGALSRRLDELVEILHQYHIDFVVKDIEFWTKCSTFVKHHRTTSKLKNLYDACCAKELMTLLDGKLYPCPYIANGLNLQSLPDEQENYVDIMEGSDIMALKSSVRKILHGREYFTLCDYCQGRPYLNISDEEKIAPCRQIKEPLRYEKFHCKNNH